MYLGAGCGLTSIALWLAGYDVIATDKEYSLPLLRENIEYNLARHQQQSMNEKNEELGTIQVYEYDWNELRGPSEQLRLAIGGEENRVDLVVLSDCVYATTSIQPLLDALDQALLHLRLSSIHLLYFIRRYVGNILFS